jgi:hypothetical protein
LSFHCFENPTVPHAIQSWCSDRNVPLSFHCFESLTVPHASLSLIVMTFYNRDKIYLSYWSLRVWGKRALWKICFPLSGFWRSFLIGTFPLKLKCVAKD